MKTKPYNSHKKHELTKNNAPVVLTDQSGMENSRYGEIKKILKNRPNLKLHKSALRSAGL